MNAIAPARTIGRREGRDRVSLPRLVWVAPLTLLVAIGVCLAIRSVAQLLDPGLSRMPQLQAPMLTLAVEGALAAIVVFIVFALFVPRPVFWYRIVGAVALVVSWVPDVALALGGTPMRTAMQFVGPLTSIGESRPSGPPPGAQGGGPPPGFFSSMPIEQVIVLMVLHAAVALVCIGLLTTLARAKPGSAAESELRNGL